ncbi:hypothetical protein [Chryseobacterium fistulae]|uniref:DUF2691 family protein n=1 Tax=Chryseobacterium fistulae TaxID=2675058 RepID=A0A6N4XLJ8_9FLAO|nr:hypothetical protein [Chryseobacterium fistulae]CAA7386748.1 hypothetical protein CHRY9393_01048 [Chryseobacterium fistulae]
MNWVIRNSTKIKFHTDLSGILKPIWDELSEYKWIITDVDFITDNEISLNFEEDFFVLNSDEFEKLMKSNTQIIWGVIAAVNHEFQINTREISKVSAEDFNVWKNDVFLIPESDLEIIAFDSGYTILKFKNIELSNKFKDYFGKEAIELQKIK